VSRSKYRNRRTTSADGITFASAREARAWDLLRLMEAAGEITRLQRQTRFPLWVNDVLVGTYVADFTALDEGGYLRVWDAKGFKTREYRLKKKLMLACHNIEIEEL
jgi:Protein of unknown function (DUF1064)